MTLPALGLLTLHAHRVDSPAQVVLFGSVLGADGEGVQDAERKGILQALILPGAQIALAQNLHADDSLSIGLSFAQRSDHRSGIGVHM